MNLKYRGDDKFDTQQISGDRRRNGFAVYCFQREKNQREGDLAGMTRQVARGCAVVPFLLLAACASAPTTRTGSLTTYEGLTPSDGVQTKSHLRVNKQNVLAARTVRITPTRFARGVGSGLSDKDRALVANRIDYALCKGLRRRLDVVDPMAAADLSVQATITHLRTTNKVAAGASVVVGFIPSALSSVPGLSPRVPFGLGSLTIEAEALNPAGTQEAAIVWSRGASYVLSSATVSDVGDAYELASNFGGDFSEVLTTGETPFGGMPKIDLPKFGGKKDADCDAYGRGSGFMGLVGGNFGMPPGWTDKGAQKGAKPDGKAEDKVGR